MKEHLIAAVSAVLAAFLTHPVASIQAEEKARPSNAESQLPAKDQTFGRMAVQPVTDAADPELKAWTEKTLPPPIFHGHLKSSGAQKQK